MRLWSENHIGFTHLNVMEYGTGRIVLPFILLSQRSDIVPQTWYGTYWITAMPFKLDPCPIVKNDLMFEQFSIV